MRELSMLEAIREALYQELERDERVMVIGQDIGAMGGVFRATEGLQERFGSERVVDTVLAEAVIVGTSIGLAAAGMIPIAEIQFLGFAHQAFHQIVPQLARIRYRSGGHLRAQVTIRAPFGGLVRTPELHSDAIEAHFAHAPGLKIAVPSTAKDAKGMLLAAIRDPDPVLFFEPLRGYRLQRDDVPKEDYEVPLGKARIAREGTDVTVIAWSGAVYTCLQAAEAMNQKGVSVKVLDLRSLVPLDIEALAKAAIDTGRVVIVHEAPLTAGFGAEVLATIQEEAFYDLEAPIIRVAAWDTPHPPPLIEEHYLPSVSRVVDAVEKLSVT
jgi:pyruvate dehydrogenase E1 component beta subunit